MAEDREALPVQYCEDIAMTVTAIMMRKRNSQMIAVIVIVHYAEYQE